MGTDGMKREAKKSLKTSVCFPRADPLGMEGVEHWGWAGVRGCDRATLNFSAQWQADGMKDADETGARTAPSSARAGQQ